MEVSRVDAMILTFDFSGRRDLAVADRQLQAAVETLGDAFGARSQPGVISAVGRFKTAGYRWTPTRDEVEAAIAVHQLRGVAP